MNLTEAMGIIESHKFAARLNAASNFRTFILAAKQEEAIEAISQELDSQENYQKILSHINELSQQRVDHRFENQWDTALAIYMWLISLKDLNLAKIAAEYASQAPQCWWAARMSHYLMYEHQIYCDSSSEQLDLELLLKKHNASQIPAAGETVFPSHFLFNLSGKTSIAVNTTICLSERTYGVERINWPDETYPIVCIIHSQDTESKIFPSRK